MSVWARSDVAAITISPDHGGCGRTHSRPAPGGNPVPVWELNCHGGCEDHLRNNSLWSATPETIPETPDEIAARESNEKRTQRDQQTRNVEVMEKLGNLPQGMAEAMFAVFGPLLAQHGIMPPADAPVAPEPDPPVTGTYEARPGALTDAQRAELEDALGAMAGDPMWKHRVGVAPQDNPADTMAAALHEAAETGRAVHAATGIALPPGSMVPDLDTMGLPALNDYAKSMGLPGRRSKADQIDAIRKHLNR